MKRVFVVIFLMLSTFVYSIGGSTFSLLKGVYVSYDEIQSYNLDEKEYHDLYKSCKSKDFYDLSNIEPVICFVDSQNAIKFKYKNGKIAKGVFSWNKPVESKVSFEKMSEDEYFSIYNSMRKDVDFFNKKSNLTWKNINDKELLKLMKNKKLPCSKNSFKIEKDDSKFFVFCSDITNIDELEGVSVNYLVVKNIDDKFVLLGFFSSDPSIKLFDIDNDGFPDIQSTYGNTEGSSIIFWKIYPEFKVLFDATLG